MLPAIAIAQTGTSSSALPSAPGTPNDPPAMAANAGGSKLAAINIEGAIFASNEGQRDMDALQKKFEPKSTELKSKNEEIEALKKQMTAAGVSDDTKANLQQQITEKQKQLDREAQDAREDFQTQQNEIGQRILQKMAPIILKYANENGLGVIIDTSNPWPQGQVVWASPSVDITKAVVEAYNVQSGVAPPPKPASSTSGIKPSGSTNRSITSKPNSTTSKPSTPTK